MDRTIEREILNLPNPDSKKRQSAIGVLRSRISIPEVQHSLRSTLFDEDGYVRILAAEALAKDFLYPADSIPVLVAVLDVTDQADIAAIPYSKEWKRVAAGAIGNYKSKAKEAIPFLRIALLDPDVNVRRYAARSLGDIGPEAIVALQDLRAARQAEEDEDIRALYEEAIKKITQSKRFIVIAQDEDNEETVEGKSNEEIQN